CKINELTSPNPAATSPRSTASSPIVVANSPAGAAMASEAPAVKNAAASAAAATMPAATATTPHTPAATFITWVMMSTISATEAMLLASVSYTSEPWPKLAMVLAEAPQSFSARPTTAWY